MKKEGGLTPIAGDDSTPLCHQPLCFIYGMHSAYNPKLSPITALVHSLQVVTMPNLFVVR